MSKSDELLLEFDSIDEIDLSFLQLFCSLHRTGLKKEKKISIKGSIPANLIELIKEIE